VARVLALVGPNRCVAWATIWRDERPNDAFNDVLRDAAKANRRVKLVEWAEMVEEDPDLLAPDRLHGSEDGYRERARKVAAAVKDCAPAQSVTPA
jgi:lysophospholipase L1-like esterase